LPAPPLFGDHSKEERMPIPPVSTASAVHVAKVKLASLHTYIPPAPNYETAPVVFQVRNAIEYILPSMNSLWFNEHECGRLGIGTMRCGLENRARVSMQTAKSFFGLRAATTGSIRTPSGRGNWIVGSSLHACNHHVQFWWGNTPPPPSKKPTFCTLICTPMSRV
jgi:hypothetical protein